MILELINKQLEFQMRQPVAFYVGNFVEGACIKCVCNCKFYFQFYWYELHIIKKYDATKISTVLLQNFFFFLFFFWCPLDGGLFFLSEYALMFQISYGRDVLGHELLKYVAIPNCFFSSYSFFHTY